MPNVSAWSASNSRSPVSCIFSASEMAALYLPRLIQGRLKKTPVSYSWMPPPAPLNWRASTRSSGSGIQERSAGLGGLNLFLCAQDFRAMFERHRLHGFQWEVEVADGDIGRPTQWRLRRAVHQN